MFDHPELYILRHGETIWNRQGRYQGRKDSPLTQKGRQQAVRQRKLLNAIETLPRKVFVSPLGRTVETARLAVAAETPTPDHAAGPHGSAALGPV